MEFLLYSQQLISNGKFALVNDFKWNYTGVAWSFANGYATKSNAASGTLYQSGILHYGCDYRLIFKMSDRTAGTLTVKTITGGTTHLSTNSNQVHTVDFTVDSNSGEHYESLIFECDTNWDGKISNVSLIELPIYHRIDITEDTVIPLNFGVDDLIELNQRKTSFSNTITFLGTKNNDKVFNHIYKINTKSKFNPKIKTRVVIKDGVKFFDGIFSLDNITSENGVNYYEATVYGGTKNIFDALNNLKISDLDFSDYDHYYDITRIQKSWNNQISIGNSAVVTSPNTEITYTSPAIIGAANVVVDGYNRHEIEFAASHSFVADDEVYVDFTSGVDTSMFDQVVLSVPSATKIILKCTAVSFGSGGSITGTVKKKTFLGIGYWYPCVDYGTYNVYQSSGLLEVGEWYFIYKHNPGDDFFLTGSPTNSQGDFYQAIATTPLDWTNGSVLVKIGDHLDDLGNRDYSNGFTDLANVWTELDFMPHIFVREVWTKMFEFTGYQYNWGVIDSKLFKHLIIPIEPSVDLEADQLIVMNEHLPQMLLSDFFRSIINMFNVVPVLDKDNPKLINFISRNDIISSTPQNWNSKLDKEGTIKTTLTNSYLPKYYHFKYSDATDFYNTDYNTELGNINNETGLVNVIDRKHGDEYVPTGNEFSEDEKLVELSFTSSVIAEGELGYYSEAFSADETGNGVSREHADRIHIAGLRSGAINLLSVVYFADNLIPSTYYPYAGHIDNYLQPFPNHDLNFGKPLGLYFTPPAEFNNELWSENNLYNKYWKKYMTQLTDNSAKIVEMDLILNDTDINDLDFETLKQIDNNNLKLSSISDWDSTGEKRCKAEFLLIQ